jgi:hypothetical protein
LKPWTREGIRWGGGIDAGSEKNLVSVDVADTSNHVLVKEEGLDGAVASRSMEA